MSLPSSYRAALGRNEPSYFTGKPCKHGHIGPRSTASRQCRECVRLKSKRQYDRVKYRERYRLKRYGISQYDFDRRAAEQGAKCLICKILFGPEGRAADSPCVDHCHTTGTIRGILCNHCNRALGLLGDDLSNVLAAATYLEQHLSQQQH